MPAILVGENGQGHGGVIRFRGHRHYTIVDSADDVVYTARDAEKQAFAFITTVESAVNGITLGTSPWQNRYKEEVAMIKATFQPKLLVAVLGATGAGKSSLINAVLGHDIVPTSGVTACTAVVTEIAFNNQNTFEADIEFLSLDEWQKEITTLLEDLRDGGDAVRGDQLDRSTSSAGGRHDDPIAIARAQIHAAYPSISMAELTGMDVNAVMHYSPLVTQLLGTTAHVKSQTANEFTSSLAQHIKIRCPSAALASGLVLVDLPGVADSNAARSRIAGDYIQKCDHFWITAPITRAVNDRTAQELLGRAFRHQIRLDGKLEPKAFTFIATKCDDISTSEIVRNLNLGTNPQYQQLRQDQQCSKDEVAKWKGQETSANSASRDITKSINDAEAKLREYKIALPARLVKRRHSDTPTSEVDQPCNKHPKIEPSLVVEHVNPADVSLPRRPLEDSDRTAESETLQAELAALQARLSDLQRSSDVLVQQSQDSKRRMQAAETELRNIRKEMSAFCALKRSEFSKHRIQADFKTGLRELGVHTEDDLPVFPVSARDHALLSEGEESVCFTDVEQTGIPALREWCHTLTLPIREKATYNLLIQLRAFIQSLHSFVEGTPGVSENDRTTMKKRWESRMDGCLREDFKIRAVREVKAKQYRSGVTWRLVNEFKDVVKNCICDLQDVFDESLGDKCEEGAVWASRRAVGIADEFANSMAWQTFRATLRRDGCWTRDLNAELLIPFSGHIAESYCEVFRRNFFADFEEEAIGAIETLLQDVVQTAPAYVQARAKRQAETCLAEARAALGNIVPTVDRALKDQQPAINRKLAPQVQAELVEGYRLAKQEKGPGSVKRQKIVVHDYVDKKKDAAFKGLTDVLTTGLHEAAEQVEERLNDDLAGLSITVEKNVAVLWEGPVDGDEQISARLEILDLLLEVSGQLDLWLAAKRVRDEGEGAPADSA